RRQTPHAAGATANATRDRRAGKRHTPLARRRTPRAAGALVRLSAGAGSGWPGTSVGLIRNRSSRTRRSATVPDMSSSHPRWRALIVLCAGMLMVFLDQTIVNVALPSIQEDVGFSQSSLAWVVNAYLIAFGGLLLLAGRFGDLLGRRSVFLAGMVVFTGASLVCGLADSQAMLIAARFVQGTGGAASSAVILGMIVTMFPKPGEQAKAIGIYSFVASAGASIG